MAFQHDIDITHVESPSSIIVRKMLGFQYVDFIWKSI